MRQGRITAMRFLTNVVFAVLAALSSPAAAGQGGLDWQKVLESARGQDVFWNAWGGDESINAYIAWVATGSRKTTA